MPAKQHDPLLHALEQKFAALDGLRRSTDAALRAGTFTGSLTSVRQTVERLETELLPLAVAVFGRNALARVKEGTTPTVEERAASIVALRLLSYPEGDDAKRWRISFPSLVPKPEHRSVAQQRQDDCFLFVRALILDGWQWKQAERQAQRRFKRRDSTWVRNAYYNKAREARLSSFAQIFHDLRNHRKSLGVDSRAPFRFSRTRKM
ncbi:hypothetical protein QFZ99_004202 [Paraburkholderia atlantica]|uniref:hypothetical protein n=1 Tax=Paraburkholderia atlantica TaxID=2654982 RepID=UPI003D2402D2